MKQIGEPRDTHTHMRTIGLQKKQITHNGERMVFKKNGVGENRAATYKE